MITMTKIKFGTDGWRAVIAKEFTTGNVARIAQGTAAWALNQHKQPTILVGHDCRFGGELFTETVTKVLTKNGIRVLLSSGFVSAPMISMGCLRYNTIGGVFITASHNPPLYSGYKLKGHYGGPLLEPQVKEIEELIPDRFTDNLDPVRLEDLQKQGLLEYVDLESMYCDYLAGQFDLEKIRRSGLRFAFDAMYGSGQNVMKRLFPESLLMHCERQPLFDGIPPEPLERNLGEFLERIRKEGNIDCGLAVDGDADRTALADKSGNYIDSHHVILLLIHYLYHYKHKTGKVVTGFSSSVKIHKLCEAYNIPLDVVRIGFKHICETMLREEVLVGGEESGGIAVTGHLPERDGIYTGLLIWEAMVETGLSLTEMIDEIYALTGPFAFERADLIVNEQNKERIVNNCREGLYPKFGDYIVRKTETLDGFKYYFSEDQWLMIRPSGTEPVLRTYAEGRTKEEALDILKAGYNTIMNEHV